MKLILEVKSTYIYAQPSMEAQIFIHFTVQLAVTKVFTMILHFPWDTTLKCNHLKRFNFKYQNSNNELSLKPNTYGSVE